MNRHCCQNCFYFINKNNNNSYEISYCKLYDLHIYNTVVDNCKGFKNN